MLEVEGKSCNKNNNILAIDLNKELNKFTITEASYFLIDDYIINCQYSNYTYKEIKENYFKLLDKLIQNETNKELKRIKFKPDFNLLFKNETTDIIYFVKIKYDDNDVQKDFVEINRKFLKTYACLVNEIKIYNKEQFKPILYYFVNRRKNGNIYIPEEEIYRDIKFLNKFFMSFNSN